MGVINTGLRFQDEIRAWSQDLNSRLHSGKAYFVSTSYGVFRGRYNVGSSEDRSPTKSDVVAGLSRAMPPDAALEAQSADVRKWYVRLLRMMLGKNFGRYPDLQPVGVGWHDEPAPKKPTNDNGHRCLPGEKFPNSHLVLVVPHARSITGERCSDQFQRLADVGVLERKWTDLVPEGTLDIRENDDVERTLDYAAKTAKRNPIYREHGILLPFARSKIAHEATGLANDNRLPFVVD